MKEFIELIKVSNILNSPEGCPWDLEQTFESLRSYVLEEAHELLEAVDEGDDQAIIEELGDVLYTVIFYAKVAEREKRFKLEQVLETLCSKLIRRHPHVFGDAANDMETIKKNWERIKQEEKQKVKGPLDGIPKTLPLFLRAQKIFRRMKKWGCEMQEINPQSRDEEIGQKILDLVEKATHEGIDVESAFRKALTRQEKYLNEFQ